MNLIRSDSVDPIKSIDVFFWSSKDLEGYIMQFLGKE